MFVGKVVPEDLDKPLETPENRCIRSKSKDRDMLTRIRNVYPAGPLFFGGSMRSHIGVALAWSMLFSALLATLPSCASAPVQQRQAERFNRIHGGMTVVEFQQVLPEAYLAGESGPISAYVFRESRYSPFDERASGWSGMVTEYVHFYFRDGKLAQWGNPGDWERSFNITIRHR